MEHYRTRMLEYLTGWFGGPALYNQKHGFPQLRENHQRMRITAELRDMWFGCMQQALAEAVSDEPLRRDLEAVFWQMADSLRKLAQLPIPRETQVLPGHGEFSTFGAELDNNYYIRSALRSGNDIF